MKELLKVLRKNGISISLDGDNLKLKFEQKSIHPELITQIKSNKAEIIQYLKEYRAGKADYDSIHLATASDTGYTLSSAQKRLWVLNQFEDGLAAYNITHQVRLSGTYDIGVFQKAIYSVVDRHEILRTVFWEDEKGEVKQWILSADDCGFQVSYLDLRKEDDKQQKMAGFIQEDSFTSFDLEKGPLLRSTIIQLADEDYTFHYNLHHIAGDAWSMNVLAQEVKTIYRAIKSGQESHLPTLGIQYKDYSVWQQNQLEKPVFTAHRNYWKNLLNGDLPLIDFPSNIMRPSIKTQNGHALKAYLSEEVSETLQAFSRKHEGSLFITLLSLWNVLVFRYTGQEDIIIGSPVAGRDHRDLEQQIGLYVNTIVLRNKLQPGQSFTTFYKHVKSSVLGALDHNAYPFDQLLEDVNVTRDVSRSMLFDIMLVLQNSGDKLTGKVSKEEITSVQDFGPCMTKFDMELNFWEVGNGIAIKVEFNTDVYEKPFVESLIRHFQHLAECFISNPEVPVGQIDLLLEEERKQLLCKFNDTDVAYEHTSATVVDLFREQARTTPDKTALKFEDRQITYAILDRFSDILAHKLISDYEVKPDDLVGISLFRSEWMPIVIVGILKAGGAYVPVDPEYPSDKKAYIAGDSAYKICIDSEFLQAFTLSLDTTDVRDIHQVQITPSNYAYAIYTSGSTGTPKGVVNHHKGLLNRLLWMKEYLAVSDKDIYLQKTPYTFDVSVWELLLPLISGGTLIMAQPEGHKDPEYLYEVINTENVTVSHFVPSMLQVFLEMMGEDKACLGLHHIICSGEALPPHTVLQHKEKLSCRIHNLYGPTETAIDVTAIDLTEVDIHEKGVTIGYPVANTYIYIVNHHMALQPVGVAGELIIGGVQVSYGYLNKEALTENHFIDSPFRQGERLYRTGDIARWNNDGTITYLGREDGQVKVRGNRVEMGEIESQLSLMPSIRKVAVLFQEVSSSEKELVAYVVGDAGQDTQSIRTYLADKVPSYAIPQYFVAMEDLPLSANGKVDKKALPDPESNEMGTGIAYVPAENEAEERLVNIFAGVLNKDSQTIGIHDNFFDLGINSIKLIKVLREINKEFGADFKAVMLLQYTNIAELSDNLFGGIATEESVEDQEDLAEKFEDIMDLMEE